MNISSESNVFLCKYRIATFSIINGSERMDLDPSNVMMIDYICDYEGSVSSVFKVSLRVDTRKRIYILKNKRDIRVKLELEKVGYDVEAETLKTNPESVISEIFNVYFNDDDENLDIRTLFERISMNEAGNNDDTSDINHENYFESQNTIELYLFNPTLLKASRYLFNRIYTQTTIQNAIGHMLTESNHNRVLMSRIENYEVYRELLIPPMPVYRALMYLDYHFGLYKRGAIVFYDLDVLYILNTDGRVTAKRPGEWTQTTFLIPELNDAIPGNAMIRQPGENIFYASINEGDINHQRSSIMNNVAVGARTKVILSDAVDTIDLKSTQDYTDEMNESIVYVKRNNRFTESVLKARLGENDGMVYISASNLDMSAFTPNKTFRVVYDETSKNQKYNGVYRLAYAQHRLQAESENYMTPFHNIVLRRTPDID